MLDFVSIKTMTQTHGPKSAKETTIVVYPEFLVGPSEDLMIRGRAFYAVWDEENGRWSQSEDVVMRIVDEAIAERCASYPEDVRVEAKLLKNFSSKKWSEFLAYCGSLPDNYHELDCKLTFADSKPAKEDYSSKKLPYSMKPGTLDAYEKIISTLYDPVERRKLEWAIGSVISGDSQKIQKFVVLYGSAGSGKSTVLNIIQMLFEGYYNVFESKALTSYNNNFALESFRGNPLVSIEHDGDLSRIEDNTKVNSIVSHEEVVVNEKRKTQYSTYFRTMLFIGTNKPVKITDSKSGLMRRLIDVVPSGNRLPFDRYQVLMAQVKFELGAIASHCLSVYSKLGMDAYGAYVPTSMMSATNDFFNFVLDHYDIFSTEDDITLGRVWEMYKTWAAETAVRFPYQRRNVQEELKEYFEEFYPRTRVGDKQVRNLYRGFKEDKLAGSYIQEDQIGSSPTLQLNHRVSIFDRWCATYPAQLATADGKPSLKWENVKTTLEDIDTHELHYVRLPENHIVIDFDIPGPDGEKDLEANLRAAAKWPSTYAELSKSGSGVHLHYIWDGDTGKLSPIYSDHIEVKVFKGKSSLRRKLTRCNDIPIATLNSGLPEKKGGKSKVIDFEGLKNEKAIRTLIEKSCAKKILPSTIQNIDFLKNKVLEEAYSSGMHYDVTDMLPKVMAFANNSTHHSQKCLEMVSQMHFKSDDPMPDMDFYDEDLVFFDVEVFPNLLVVVWKRHGDYTPVKMINPKPSEIEILMRMRLVGFNCRRYDNHILYARLLGFTNLELYELSKGIISNSLTSTFAQAYGASYTDVFDFCSKKQSLKKWEIELKQHHQELGYSWDQPVPEDQWDKVAEYCVNDVLATEAVFDARQDDWHAREMLAELSGLTVNDTNRRQLAKIVFGNDKRPQDKFVYTDLSTGMRSDGTQDSHFFPGYKYSFGKSTYRGCDVGEGGLVYAVPGMYFGTIKTFDVVSMHPHSIKELNLFGKEYTQNFVDLVEARKAIKRGDYELAGTMLGGRLKPYLGSPENASKLAYALKIIINTGYGLTAANFDCEFRDPRNVDNIVAKRGALFMVDLKFKVEEAGGTVIHIKTDSIKVLNPSPEIESLIVEYGRDWGYSFEVESVYDKMCLVNDAVYVAHEDGGGWTATGAQFQVPYIFKTLFSHEPLEFDDFCETKSVTSTSKLYLDMNEDLGDEHAYRFVGNVGQFCPILHGRGGGLLMREKDGKYYAVAGTKGYRWLESETLEQLPDRQEDIDVGYYEVLLNKAKKTISQFGDLDEFVKE